MQKARRAVSPPLLYIILFLQFPEIDLARLLVQLQIAVIPGLFNLPIFKGFANCAVRLFSVGAVIKPALTDESAEIRKCVLQVLFQYNIHLVRVKGRESRSIGHIGILRQFVQFHMAGGMTAPA